jgi:hypothetical protein
MRQGAMALVLIAMLTAAFGAVAGTLLDSIKNDQKRSIVYNPCDDNPKTNGCDVGR